MSERPVEVEGAIAHLNSAADTPRTTFDALDPMLKGRKGARVNSRFLVRQVRSACRTSVN